MMRKKLAELVVGTRNGEVASVTETHGPLTFVACCSTPGPVQSIDRLELAFDIFILTGVGGLESHSTVTVNVHVSTAPAALVTVLKTLVTPVGKKLPEGGTVLSVKFVLQNSTSKNTYWPP